MKSPSKKQKNSSKKLSSKVRVSGSVSSVQRYYSGNASKTFWKIIGNLKNDSDRNEIYSLGVALQNHEEYVLIRLADVKKRSVHGLGAVRQKKQKNGI